MKQSLYEINSELAFLLDNSVNEETGEITAETSDNLTALTIARTDKIRACRCYFMNLKGDIAKADAEIDRISAYKKRLENQVEWLKNYLTVCIEPGEIVKDDAGRKLITWRESTSLKIIDEQAVIEYCEHAFPDGIRVKIEVNKPEIKKQAESGVGITGCVLETKQNIQIH